jgi:Ca2+-binding EF-hand superfamily protein
MMKISDLSLQEVDMLMLSLDVDSDGSIQYKEFLRKLSRHGVRNRTSEEQIVLLIIEALKKANMNMSEAFEITDKEKKGTITRDDFKDIFKSLKLNGKI